jgi:hypothetical protein
MVSNRHISGTNKCFRLGVSYFAGRLFFTAREKKMAKLLIRVNNEN